MLPSPCPWLLGMATIERIVLSTLLLSHYGAPPENGFFCSLTCSAQFTETAVLTRVIALVMLLTSIIMATWSGYMFQKRAMYLE